VAEATMNKDNRFVFCKTRLRAAGNIGFAGELLLWDL